MREVVEAWQHLLMVVCLSGLGVMLLALIVRAGFAPLWECLRKWWSLQAIQKFVCATFVLGMIYYGATKSTSHITFDGLTNSGSTIEGDSIHIAWTYSGIPDSSTVYIDYRPNSEHGGTPQTEWTNLAETIASARQWNGTLTNAEDYDYLVYSVYIPPAPVHTNGVWFGQAYKTRSGGSFVIVNGRIVDDGQTIATPALKRKESNE